MRPTERIIRAILLNPKRSWKKVELARYGKCSKPFVTKLIKKLENRGMLAVTKNKIQIISFSKLLNHWSLIHKMPKPVFINSKKKINSLKKLKNYSLTLLSGAWQRIKFMKTNNIEIYVSKSKLKYFKSRLGKVSKTPSNMILYPEDEDIVSEAEKIKGLKAVHILQNYVDLIYAGGTGVRVANMLAKKYNIFGV